MGGECWLGSKYQSSRTGCSIFPAVRPCTGYLASLYYSVLICIMGMFTRIKQLHITCLEACLAYSASPINVSQQQPWQNQAETLLTTGRSQLITVQPPTKAPQGPPLAFWAPILSRPAARAMHGHRERPGERRLRERERETMVEIENMLLHHHRRQSASPQLKTWTLVLYLITKCLQDLKMSQLLCSCFRSSVYLTSL